MPAPTRPPAFIVDASPATLAPKRLRVDRDQCVVYGVRFVGSESKNGFDYPETPLRAAVALFDGVDVNVGHHFDPVTREPLPAPVEAKLGRTQSPRWENGGITGDVRYNPSHPFADRFLWACENDPGMYGMSQVSKAAFRTAPGPTGNVVVDRWLAVSSVDVVGRGAATNSLIDSFTPGTAAVPIDIASIAQQITDQGALEDFLTNLMAALDSIDPATKATVLEHLLAAATGSQPDLPADGTQDTALTDSLRRLNTPAARRAAVLIDSHRSRAWAEELIDKEGLPADLRGDLFTGIIADSFGNEARAKALIADRKRFATPAHTGGTAGGTLVDHHPPKYSPPARGGQTSPQAVNQTIKELVDGYVAE